MSTTSKPFVLILDIDGTLIGDISPQVMLYDIVKEMKKNKGNVTFDNNDLIYKLKNGVFRPNFKEFIDTLNGHFASLELFIFTASQKQWANFLIKVIEKAYNIRFNRPIFTRDDCTNINHEYIKNLTKIKARILKSLKKKYPSLTLQDMNNRLLMIDNNRVFHDNDLDKVLICPSYTFRYPENIPIKIKPDIFEKHSKHIGLILERYIENFPSTSNYLKFQRYFYKHYLSDLFNNKDSDKDVFWTNLGTLITQKKIYHFDEKVVKYLNYKIWKGVT